MTIILIFAVIPLLLYLGNYAVDYLITQFKCFNFFGKNESHADDESDVKQENEQCNTRRQGSSFVFW